MSESNVKKGVILREKVSFYAEDVSRWISSLEAHRDGLKGRAWLCQKMIDDIKEKMKKHQRKSLN